MKHYIPIESAIMDDNRVCELINTYGMKGLGAYLVMLIELRNRRDYVCTMESLRLISRKCRTTPKFLQSIVMDFNLFSIDKSATNNPTISSPYVNEIMRAYNETVEKRRQAGRINANKQWSKKNGNTMAKEKNNHINDYSYKTNNHLYAADYPYETVDPETGQRSVDGKIIPAGAPPRTSPTAVWSDARECWV